MKLEKLNYDSPFLKYKNLILQVIKVDHHRLAHAMVIRLEESRRRRHHHLFHQMIFIDHREDLCQLKDECVKQLHRVS